MVNGTSAPVVAGRRRWRARLGLWRSLLAVARTVAPSTPRAIAGIVTMLRGLPARLGEPLAPKWAVAGGRHFLALQMPGWPSAAWDRYLAGELGRYAGFGLRDTLASALVAVTRACPL